MEILDENLENTSDKHTLSIKMIKQIRFWVKLVAILGFVFLGIMLLGSVWLILNRHTTIGQSVYSVHLFLFFLIPLIFLLRFSRKIRRFQNDPSKENLNQFFGSLKTVFKVIGIQIIVIFSLFVVALLFTIVSDILDVLKFF